MPQLTQPVSPEHHASGSQEKKNAIVLYGDLQCPRYAAAALVMRRLLQDFGLFVAYTFRNFPMTSIHPYAFDAACAAEAAGKRGKYWEMHDAILANQTKLSDEFFMGVAQKLRLEDGRFVADAISKTVHNKINMDFKNGLKSGVTETPAFFVNGKRYKGSAEDLYEWIARSIGEGAGQKRSIPQENQRDGISCPTSSVSVFQQANFVR